jgi:hypothetical protein
MEFCLIEDLFNISKCSLTCRNILRYGANGFTSPSEGISAADFIDLKNPSPSAGFEPTNLWSNGKQANHKTTDDDSTEILHRSFNGAVSAAEFV